MYANYGFYLVLLAAIGCGWAFLASLGAAFTRHRRLYRSAKYALTISTTFTIFAAILLWIMLYQRDYSVEYIYKNSSNDLPVFYTFTAFWCSLEGSHFLWTLLLSAFTTIAIWTGQKDNEHIMPYVTASLSSVLAWMYYLLVSHSDPFVRMLPAFPNGRGMNELLQNPYMAIHPPTLFVGYTALAIPAAYSVAALCYGDITEGWLRTTRRWALVAWTALTAGIILGGRWAYVELGWAGYWAWDPVENSSFIPWLFGTALLHSLVVQDKLGHLKKLTLILSFFGFFFSFFGTFITRSGLVSSVHSFAESSIGPNYLVFLAALLAVVIVLFALRSHSIIPPETDKVWGVSKESALVITQFLLLTLAVIVCVGTLYPIVTEWITDERTTVQAPYFNKFAPWIGLGLICAIAVGNIMRFQSNKIPNLRQILAGGAVIGAPLTVILIWQGDVISTSEGFALGAQLVGMVLSAWSIGILLMDLYFRLKDIRFKYGLFYKRNKAYIGGLLAHLGLLIMIIGFLGNYRGIMKVTTLKKGEMTEMYGYKFQFDGIKIGKGANTINYEAPLSVKRFDKDIGIVTPMRSRYPTKQELLHEVGLLAGFWYDIYATLSAFDSEEFESATFELHINPTVRFVWIATIIMCIGGLIALMDGYRGQKSRDVIAPLENG